MLLNSVFWTELSKKSRGNACGNRVVAGSCLELSQVDLFAGCVAYKYTRDDKLSLGAFHVFNRASHGRLMFRDDRDREKFAEILIRHLSAVPHFDRFGRQYECLRERVSLLACNLMTTHFHLVLWQKISGGIESLIHRALSAYTRYYNRRHGTRGPLFEHEYCARRIESRESLRWRIAYVNDNHKGLGVDYKFSTHRYMLEPHDCPTWLDVNAALKAFGSAEQYLEYLAHREVRNRLDKELRG